MNWLKPVKLAISFEGLYKKFNPQTVDWAKSITEIPAYAQWAIFQLNKKNIIAGEDDEVMKETFKAFEKAKKDPLFQNKDINKFKTKADFIAAVSPYKEYKSIRKKQEDAAIKGETLLEQSGDYKFFRIDSYEAMAKWATGTGWCVANKDHYDRYRSEGDFLLFVRGDSPIGLMHVGTGQFKNVNDGPMSISDVAPFLDFAYYCYNKYANNNSGYQDEIDVIRDGIEQKKDLNFKLKTNKAEELEYFFRNNIGFFSLLDKNLNIELYSLLEQSIKNNIINFLASNVDFHGIISEWNVCSEELKKDLKSYFIESVQKLLKLNPEYFAQLPNDLRTEELAQFVYPYYKERYLEKASYWDAYYDIPKEILKFDTDNSMKNKAIEGWSQELKQDLKSYSFGIKRKISEEWQAEADIVKIPPEIRENLKPLVKSVWDNFLYNTQDIEYLINYFIKNGFESVPDFLRNNYKNKIIELFPAYISRFSETPSKLKEIPKVYLTIPSIRNSLYEFIKNVDFENVYSLPLLLDKKWLIQLPEVFKFVREKIINQIKDIVNIDSLEYIMNDLNNDVDSYFKSDPVINNLLINLAVKFSLKGYNVPFPLNQNPKVQEAKKRSKYIKSKNEISRFPVSWANAEENYQVMIKAKQDMINSDVYKGEAQEQIDKVINGLDWERKTFQKPQVQKLYKQFVTELKNQIINSSGFDHKQHRVPRGSVPTNCDLLLNGIYISKNSSIGQEIQSMLEQKFQQEILPLLKNDFTLCRNLCQAYTTVPSYEKEIQGLVNNYIDQNVNEQSLKQHLNNFEEYCCSLTYGVINFIKNTEIEAKYFKKVSDILSQAFHHLADNNIFGENTISYYGTLGFRNTNITEAVYYYNNKLKQFKNQNTKQANWYKKIKIANSQIQISINNYTKSLIYRINSILEFGEKEKQRLSTFSLDINNLENNLKILNYPNIPLLLKSLQDRDSLNDLIWDFYNFQRKLDYKNPNWTLARKTLQELRDFETQNGSIHSEFSEKDAEELIKQYNQETYQNGLKTKQFLENVISNISNWNNSPITLDAYEIDKDNDIGPEENFTVYFGDLTSHTSFTLFNNKGKYIAEDVIDASEGEDFFPNPQITSDYFNLIREIQKPGSSSQGKVITLYTARPIKDREWYLNNQSLPPNVFLTQTYDHAEGLAIDLGGNERRDIWKVRINTKYLIQTLEGMEKQYQVISNSNVPVSMELINLGE